MLRTLTLLAALALPGAALACPAQPLPQSAQAELPVDGTHDTQLFGQAVLHHVNRARCEAGLTALAPLPVLSAVATAHSQDMVRLDFFDHISPVAGRETLVDRVRPTGLSLARVAENIGQIFGVDYEPGRRYRALDAANCQFTYEGGTPVGDALGSVVGRAAEPIPRHSYDSAGARIVGNWLASPGHRANIMAPDLTRHGAGFATGDRGQLCGRLFVTQVLIQ
ncbi:CAP domain-containing protein [Roseobacter sp. HKCCA0434]|uniref:CAP domain-containing protein n=1 Tax=Roseobacter sp. HKCCA0434 TaxID=3079297 RepID=UPI0029058E2B|nr:CAP domain-containing protein [Roseobacter sp. HKCCA0434]